MCVTVVQWSRSYLNVQIKPGSSPVDAVSVSLYRFYSLFGLFFLLTFFSLFLLLTLLVMHLDQYICCS